MDNISLAINEEIALEGLDGITLDSFWFRISERLKLPLPFHEAFKSNLWNIILKRDCFEFFEIEEARKTIGRLNRIDYLAKDETAMQEVNEFYHIYSYDPVDDPLIRGSCKEFKTRKKLDVNELKQKQLSEVFALYGNKLVIVASQKLRNSVLIPSNIGRECDINNYVYCILERIGRARYFGETTSGPFSLYDYVKDSKLLHYFRSCLLKNDLVFRQQIIQKLNGKTHTTQMFHIPKYYLAIKTSELSQVERVFAYLLSKPNYISSLEDLKKDLDMKNQKILATLLKTRHEVFEYRKFLYRDLHPNANKKMYATKTGNEKTILAVKLVNPNLDIFELYENEDKDIVCEEESSGYLDISQQKFKHPLVYQVIDLINKSGSRGMSQSEIGKYFGLSKLNSRAVIRKTQKLGIVSYMRDEGRQRVTMFISKQFSNEKSMEFVNQVAKLFKKVEEKVSAIKMVPFDTPEDTNVDSSCQPKSTSDSPMKKSISTLNSLKQEATASTNVIQYVRPKINLAEQMTPGSTGADVNKVVLMPNDDYSFVDNVENVTVSLRFLNNIPGLQKQTRGLQEDLAKNRVSEKVLTRMNIILDAIREKTVMDPINLLMTVRKVEENFAESICRKSILGLCSRLAADNFIKVIEMELTSPSKNVKLLYFGEPTITFDLRCWHSIIEEQKIQNFVTMTKNVSSEDACEDNSADLIGPSSSFASKTSIGYDELEAQSPIHENFPKFMKYRLFHEFLYYLIYDYPVNAEKIQVKKAVEIWRRENQRLTDYEEIAEKISICYSTEINWKMFIPPLNPQLEYNTGWGLLRDIIHRIPLILYVKFTRYGHFSPEINDYLMHPIKSNYLLHFLPPKMFTALTQGRKYVQVISDLCKRLCWMGLLQFGPMRAKELDQSYIYLNKNAMLLDTRDSEPGYLEVSDQEYPKLTFHFGSLETVTNYWTSMHEICVNTRINFKSVAIGKTIILEPLHLKPELIDILKIQNAISAPLNDNGEVPGDRKGAGGLDKAFMSHLKQNWSRSIDRKKRPISALAIEKVPKSKSKKEKKRKEKVKSEGKSTKKKSSKVKAATKEIQKSKTILQSKGVSSKSKIIRKVKAKKQTVKEMKKKAEMYDEVDKEALKLMKTLRVTWSDIEDKTLSLVKVAMKFAFPNDNQCAHYINFGMIRDILHWRTEKALNKTSRACQRRLMYLMKNNKAFREQTILYLEELRANREFSNKYSNFAERLKKLYNQEQIYLVVKVHLVEMVHRMHQIFFKQYLSTPLDLECAKDEIILKIPQNYEELIEKYKIINPSSCQDDLKYHEPLNSNEIEIFILSSLIHGVVCSANDKTSNVFFLHETYSKFTDDSLGAAVNLLRRLTIISLNKNQKNKKSIMPRTISPFHLSSRYALQLMSVHVPVDLYDEYLDAVREMSNENGIFQMKSMNCGWIFMIAEFFNKNLISMKTERNDKATFLLDTPMRRKTNFEKISDNYLAMKKRKEQGSINEIKNKNVRFHADSNSDEKFIYHDDPIEIFCKLDTIYLHIFCILQGIEHMENISIAEWTCIEHDKCSLKNCILRSGNNFSIEVQKIACHGYEIIKYILSNSDQGPSKYDEKLITKFNLVKFFDGVIDKYNEDNALHTKRNLGKIDSSEMRRKITTIVLLENIQRMAREIENEDGAWLSEYKKISHHKTEDDFYDEEDEQSKAMQKSTSNLKDLNLNKISDSFVVNLPSLQIITKNLNSSDKVSVDGDLYINGLIPFDEDMRLKIIEDIKMQHVWMPEEFEKTSMNEKLLGTGLSATEDDIKQMKLFCDFLISKKHTGAKYDEILDEFGSSNKQQLEMYIKLLIMIKFILRTGVNEIRFVHKDFAAFWLIDTFYLTPKDSEETEPFPKKLKIENEEAPNDEEMKTYKDNSTGNPELETVDNKQDDSEKNYKRNPFFLLPCPWIRVGSLNRTLNRRCFDKWLATILNYLSVNPGILLSDLCAKFNVITPIHVRFLCETLELIGCVKLMAFPELNISIFSEYDVEFDETKPATYLDSFDRTFIEVNPDAFQRLTFFIGKKKYKIPFI